MTELWFEGGPATPNAILGSQQALLYQTANDEGWAALRRPIISSWADEIAELPATLGSLLHVMGSQLERGGATFDARTRAAIVVVDGPAESVGIGDGALLTLDDHLRYAASWKFGPYQAMITIYDQAWLATLFPAHAGPVALRSTSDLHIVTAMNPPVAR
jgi:hypothetical protein